MEASWFAYLLSWFVLGSVVQSTGKQFPTCKTNVTERCILGCVKVKISVLNTTEYSSNNTLCIDNRSPAQPTAGYRLVGCPNQYFNTYQGTGGACVVAAETGHGRDIILTEDELPEGFYQFICFVNSSYNINSSAIVASDDSPYRDVLVYNNGVLQNHYNSTNVTVDARVGDHITVVARAIGNVSILNASDERFTCITGFACENHTRNYMDNRYLQCSLNSPAEPSDDGRTLTILLDDTELITITLIALLDHSTTATASIEPTTTLPMNTTASFSNASTAHQIPSSTGQSTNTSSNGGMSGGVIAAVVITVVIAVALVATVCVILYCKHKKLCVHKKRPRDAVNHTNSAPQQVILNSACPHCTKLEPHITGKGYDVRKLSQEHLTDDQITLLNEGALLIFCSCMECAAYNQLYESSSVSKDWLVVQLHQGDAGDNPLQSNGKLKTVTFNDLDNDRAVDEVLSWFETESHKGTNTTTSTNEQQQNTSTKELLEYHTEMLEELRSGVGALQKDNVNSLRRQISAE